MKPLCDRHIRAGDQRVLDCKEPWLKKLQGQQWEAHVFAGSLPACPFWTVNMASLEHHHRHFLPHFCFWHAVILVFMILLHLSATLPPENAGPSNTETSAKKAQPGCLGRVTTAHFWKYFSIQYFLQCKWKKTLRMKNNILRKGEKLLLLEPEQRTQRDCLLFSKASLLSMTAHSLRQECGGHMTCV